MFAAMHKFNSGGVEIAYEEAGEGFRWWTTFAKRDKCTGPIW